MAAPVRWQVWGMIGLFRPRCWDMPQLFNSVSILHLTQARYFFPMIAPAVLLMVGLREITPSRGRGYVQNGVVTGLIALNVYIFAAYVIPYWYSIDTLRKYVWN